MNVAIINWTGNQPHFGCQLVGEAITAELDRVGIELAGTVRLNERWADFRPMLDKVDLVLVNGEGSIHHNRRRDLPGIAHSYPSVLFNSVWQDHIGKNAPFLAKYCRESLSAAECGGEVMADVVLLAPTLLNFKRPDEIRGTLCVTDSAARLEGAATQIPPSSKPAAYLQKLSEHRGVVCGRFHALMACICLGVPFACYPSNTHKIDGALRDMGLPHLLASAPDRASRLVPDTLPEEAAAYVQRERAKLRRFFEGLGRF